MNLTSLHPNTQTLLSAWERMTDQSSSHQPSPKSDDHPDLLAALFVIQKHDEDMWLFRSAGSEVRHRLGRDPVEHNFLELWQGYDREITTSVLKSAHEHNVPAILQARAEPLSGQALRVEITLASLYNTSARSKNERLIGLYQVIEPERNKRTSPSWPHTLEAIYPPQTKKTQTHLRLVANNG